MQETHGRRRRRPWRRTLFNAVVYISFLTPPLLFCRDLLQQVACLAIVFLIVGNRATALSTAWANSDNIVVVVVVVGIIVVGVYLPMARVTAATTTGRW